MSGDESQRLRDYIDAVAARGDSRLPPESRLAADLGVSRGRLRTLLQKLEDEELIWRHVGKGTFIGPRRHEVETVARLASCSVDDQFDARAVLEPQLAGQAAIHARPEDLDAMDRAIEEMRAATSMIQWKRLDDRLHRAIAVATHNELLVLLYDCLHAQVQRRLDVRIEAVYGREPGPKDHTERHHRECVEAIRVHDPVAAEDAMRRHLRAVREALFGLR